MAQALGVLLSLLMLSALQRSCAANAKLTHLDSPLLSQPLSPCTLALTEISKTI